MSTQTAGITTHRTGQRIGVNRNGKPVGYAIQTNRKSQPEHWTVYVNVEAPPFDVCRTGFANADAAVAFLAKHGYERTW